MFDKEALEKIKEIIRPVIEGDNLEFVGIEFKVECGRKILRIFIDKENGVNVEDCAKISGRIDSLLDSCAFVSGSYCLEVSSPGLDRPLFGEPDFKKFEGSLVKIKISHAIDGQKNFIGYLRGCKDQNIILEEKCSGKNFEINLSNISKAKLEIDVL
ncbi:MAG: ribosome maturation factor RimP [bacterium]|nr:ribosome maturation factor RimP [bacterium]